jgi:hypothetical protein
MTDIVLKIIPIFVTLAICFGGIIFSFGKVKQMIAETVRKEVENANQIEYLRKLYQQAMSKVECERQSDKCRIDLCNKIDDIKKTIIEVKNLMLELNDRNAERIDALDEKREQARDENKDQLLKILVSVAKLETIMGKQFC